MNKYSDFNENQANQSAGESNRVHQMKSNPWKEDAPKQGNAWGASEQEMMAKLEWEIRNQNAGRRNGLSKLVLIPLLLIVVLLGAATISLGVMHQRDKEQVTNLQGTVTQLQRELSEIDTLKQQMDQVQGDQTELEQELNSVKGELRDKENELSDVQAKLKTANNELSDAKAKLKTANNKLSDSKKELKTAKNELKKLKKNNILISKSGLSQYMKSYSDFYSAKNVVFVKAGKEKTVKIHWDGTGTVTCNRANMSIASSSWGDWSGKNVPLTVNGVSKGTTVFTISNSSDSKTLKILIVVY